VSRLAQATIHLDALRHNLSVVRSTAPTSHVMAVLKANAYGHGLLPVAHELAPDVDAFAVSCLEEALPLRMAGLNGRIVLLEGFFAAEEIMTFSRHHLDAVIHQPWQIEALAQAPIKSPIDCWLKVDTGMGRLGFLPNDALAAAEQLQRLEGVASVRWMTHLANADEPESTQTDEQLERLSRVLDSTHQASVANSAGTLQWPESHVDWVRPGIMLYGSSPFAWPSPDAALQPAMTLEAELISVKTLAKGHGVGYGGRYICPQAMPVGVVSIGYGDGYPRHAPDGTPVGINGQRAQLIGKVSMDMLCVDLRDVPQAQPGDRVILWGADPVAGDIAQACQTISYELFCRLTPRVQRVYRRGYSNG